MHLYGVEAWVSNQTYSEQEVVIAIACNLVILFL